MCISGLGKNKSSMKIWNKKELIFVIQADWMMNRGKLKLKDKLRGVVESGYIMQYLEAMRNVSYYKNGGGIFGMIQYITTAYIIVLTLNLDPI